MNQQELVTEFIELSQLERHSALTEKDATRFNELYDLLGFTKPQQEQDILPMTDMETNVLSAVSVPSSSSDKLGQFLESLPSKVRKVTLILELGE